MPRNVKKVQGNQRAPAMTFFSLSMATALESLARWAGCDLWMRRKDKKDVVEGDTGVVRQEGENEVRGPEEGRED
eukprot:754528-Hanusia_phi.AAC.4